MKRTTLKGFTLIELIITISILAVLIAIVVVTLNPAEQLQRSRDTKRASDLDALKAAISLYLAQATGTANLSGNPTPNTDCLSVGISRWWVNTAGSPTAPSSLTLTTSTGQQVATSTFTGQNLNTWMPVLLGQTPGGSPLSQLPLDPTNGKGNSTSRFYSYACRESTKTYEITARLESNFYTADIDLDGTDGGNSATTYEVGTDLTIISDTF